MGGELLVHGGSQGRPPQTYPYDRLFADPQGDQTLLRSWRQEDFSLLCTCKPDAPVRMGLRNHPVAKETIQVLYKMDRHHDHDSTCPRFAEDSPTPAKRVVEKPAVYSEIITLPDGKMRTRVLIHMKDLFTLESADALENRTTKPGEANPEGETGQRRLERHSTSTTLTKRAWLEFGGFIREWYLLGLQSATEYWHRPPRQLPELLKAMRHVMLDERIALDDQRSLKQIALIPSRNLDPSRIYRRIVVGEVVRRTLEGNDEIWSLRGTDTMWPIRVLRRHLPPHGLHHHLTALRVTMAGDEAVTTHRSFDTMVHPNGCVWVDSSHEFAVYDDLARFHIPVEKPALPSEEWFGFCPDFVIRGHGAPIVIEIWGLSQSNPEYHRHMLAKQKIYRAAASSGVIQFLEWDVELHGDVGRLRLIERVRKLTAKAPDPR